MQPYILQDWTTIRSSVTTVTQGESEWLDLALHEDVVFYLDVREVTGTTPTMSYQTSPNKEDVLFQSMAAAINLVNGMATTVTVVRLNASPNVPLARFVRWQITGPAGTWDATFRILVAANSLC
jgi:hypothetical protein